MPLERLTITGAHDATDPKEMIALQQQYPFVEWGILIGSSGGGVRFPSTDWIAHMQRLAIVNNLNLNLSLHICDRWLRDIAAATPTLMADHLLKCGLRQFQRCQLNWHGEQQPAGADMCVRDSFFFLRQRCGWSPQIIFQMDGQNDCLMTASITGGLNCAALHDVSHGAGVLPDHWPGPFRRVETGWAGGLGPDNLAEQLATISRICGENYTLPWWVDMETRVRTDDGVRLDMQRVRQCLQIADEFRKRERDCT